MNYTHTQTEKNIRIYAQKKFIVKSNCQTNFKPSQEKSFIEIIKPKLYIYIYIQRNEQTHTHTHRHTHTH